MSSKILITGAAGYIGGSLVADMLANNNGLIKKNQILAAVRSEEQAKALSKLTIDVLRLDLTNEKAVVEAILLKNISIVIHCASSLNPQLALNLITALREQRKNSGKETYFIHTSALSAFYESSGWPKKQTTDTDPIFELEKQSADSNPIRKTDVTVVEYANAQNVTSYVVIPSTVYGKGSGDWNQLSVVLPVYVQAIISNKAIYKFAENTKVSGVHISDMTALYQRIVEKILQKETIPRGIDGYYFALAHDLYWWEVLDHLAVALRARGLISESKIQIWPSDQVAAKTLGVPVEFVQVLWNSGENIISENTRKVGWNPAWDKARFLQNINDEIQAVLELGKAKSSLIDSLFEFARG